MDRLTQWFLDTRSEKITAFTLLGFGILLGLVGIVTGHYFSIEFFVYMAYGYYFVSIIKDYIDEKNEDRRIAEVLRNALFEDVDNHKYHVKCKECGSTNEIDSVTAKRFIKVSVKEAWKD